MTACELDCLQFYNSTRGDRFTVTCSASGANIEQQHLYLDDVNYNADARMLSPGEVYDETHFLADNTSMTISVDSMQPQHFISYTFSAKCYGADVGGNDTINQVFIFQESVYGQKHLSPLDYALFSGFLVISLAIGVGSALWQLYKQRKANEDPTVAEFLLASRSMHVLPLTLSLVSSFMSAIALIGTPAEIYTYGTMLMINFISLFIFIPISAHVFIPFFYNSGYTSVYEFLEKRFSLWVRRLAALTFLVQMLLYVAMVIYTPAIAMEAVSDLSMWTIALVSTSVCVIYTSMGGLRAAVWTDVFQVMLMMVGLVVLLIQGSYREAGLFDRAWTMAERGGRIDFWNFDPNPLLRHSFWSLVLGTTCSALFIYGINEAQVQRALSAATLREAQLSYYFNIPGLLALWILPALCGIIVIARYAYCDPVLEGRIAKTDQMIPLYVMEVISEDLPGFPGLFIAMLLSGALSSMSSGLNGISAVFVKDFATPLLFNRYNWPEKRRARVSKLFSFIFGIISVLLIFPIQYVPGVLNAALAIGAALGGPILGLFIIGIFIPFVAWPGALIGTTLSLMFTTLLVVGNMILMPQNYDKLSLSVEACPPPNATQLFYEEVPVDIAGMDSLDQLFSISYQYYSVVGLLVTLIMSILFHFLFQVVGCKWEKPSSDSNSEEESDRSEDSSDSKSSKSSVSSGSFVKNIKVPQETQLPKVTMELTKI